MASIEKNTTVNIGVANGGIKGNVVAPDANMEIDVRFADNSEIKRFDNAITEITENANKCGINVKIKKLIKNAMVYTDKTDEYIKHIQKITEENNIVFKHRARGGLSDGNILSGFGVLCIDGIGPTGDCDHSPDKYMEIDSVIPYYNLSKFLIKDLADRKAEV